MAANLCRRYALLVLLAVIWLYAEYRALPKPDAVMRWLDARRIE